MAPRFALLVLLWASPLRAQDQASPKRLEAIAQFKKLRAHVPAGPERAEIEFRYAMLLEEEATARQGDLGAAYRADALAAFQFVVDGYPTHPRAAEARAHVHTAQKAAPPPSGAIVSDDEALHVARVDWDAELARAPFPQGLELDLECCLMTSVLGAPVGVAVRLRLPGFPEAPGAERPTTSLGGYQVAVAGEAKVLRRPDFTALRSGAVAKAAAAQRAATLAHAKVMTLEAAAPWRARGGGYSTSLVPSSGRTWNVYFRAPDESFAVTVDLAKNAVTRVTVGAAARVLP